MFSLLDPRLWVAVLLAVAVSSAGSYLKGRSDGTRLERAVSSAAIGKANVESFKTTERLQRNADEASSLAALRATDDRNRAAGADRAISGLRGTLDATQRHAAESLAAATQTVAAYRAVFEDCSRQYLEMAKDAAGHASDSLMYQEAWPK